LINLYKQLFNKRVPANRCNNGCLKTSKLTPLIGVVDKLFWRTNALLINSILGYISKSYLCSQGPLMIKTLLIVQVYLLRELLKRLSYNDSHNKIKNININKSIKLNFINLIYKNLFIKLYIKLFYIFWKLNHYFNKRIFLLFKLNSLI
jgi:hypothetical protein